MDEQITMPPKKKTGRDSSSFQANVTASLRIMHKNAHVNNNSLLYEIASTTAGLAYNHIANPLYGYVKNSLFTAADETIEVTKSKTPLTPDEIKTRQKDTESDSTNLNKKLETIESKIIILYKEKKLLDLKEKHIKTENQATKGPNNKLAAQDLKRRLEILSLIDNLLVDKVDLLPNLIREHASRRVDLIFHLMIAVYKKNLHITKGKTERQHGKGSKKTGTAACHASLIPHPVFEKVEFTPASKLNSLITNSIYGLFYTPENKPTSTVNTESTFLKGCYLEDVLNLTDELPTIVNDFDCHMEGKWGSSNAVNATIKILNQVSLGKLDPIQGMNNFGRIMSMFFSHIQYKYVEKTIEYKANANVLYPKAFAKVWRYQQQGTLPMFNIETKAIENGSSGRHIKASLKSDYIYLMLNLHQLNGAERLTRFVYSGIIENKILEMQKEILNNTSYFDAKLTN